GVLVELIHGMRAVGGDGGAVKNVSRPGAAGTRGRDEHAALLQVTVQAAAVHRYDVGRTTDAQYRVATVIHVRHAVAIQIPPASFTIESAAEVVPETEVEAGQVVHLG